MATKKLILDDVEKQIKSLIIDMYISVGNGEVYFSLSHRAGKKLVTRKCLYDALSDFGIDYGKAKEIVAEVSAQTKKTFTYKLTTSDLSPKYVI